MAAPGWAALQQDWALFSTSQTIGQTQNPTNLAPTMTVGKRDLHEKKLKSQSSTRNCNQK
jgi:hypothetical protein